jgi:parallel beta-helix repeat protein
LKIRDKLYAEQPFFLGPLLLAFAVLATLVLIRHPGITGFQVLDENYSGTNDSISSPVEVLIPLPEVPDENTSINQTLLPDAENASGDGQEQLNETLTVPDYPDVSLNLTENLTLNLTYDANITINETINVTVNVTIDETNLSSMEIFDEQLVQGVARVGIPVVWTKRIIVNTSGDVVVQTSIPGYASRIAVLEEELVSEHVGVGVSSAVKLPVDRERFNITRPALLKEYSEYDEITGFSVASQTGNGIFTRILRWFDSLFGITGSAVLDVGNIQLLSPSQGAEKGKGQNFLYKALTDFDNCTLFVDDEEIFTDDLVLSGMNFFDASDLAIGSHSWQVLCSLEDEIFSSENVDFVVSDDTNVSSVTGPAAFVSSQPANATIDITIADVIDSPKAYEIVYETPAPMKEESVIAPDVKRIVISSDVHYENIIASANLEAEYPEEAVKLYSLDADSREEVSQLIYLDADGDSLADSIEWVVPSLSNRTYELVIEVLNVQSYPSLGGEWKVMFRTAGSSDLIITPFGNTSFSEFLADNNLTEDDLEFLDIGCGSRSLKPDLLLVRESGETLSYPQLSELDSLAISSLLIKNYSCTETGYLTMRELDGGHHYLLFEFGGRNATAENYVSKISCEIKPKVLCSDTHVLYISDTYNAHAELNNQSNYAYALCCKEAYGEKLETNCSATKAETILRLEDQTNSHVEKDSESNYAYQVCLSPTANYNISCVYASDCSGYDSCLASISSTEIGGDTNLQIGSCTGPYAYSTKLCCGTNVTSSCVTPYDDLEVMQDIALCSGTYYLNDANKTGVLRLMNDYAVVRCNSTIIIGDGTGTGAYVAATSSILDCDFRNYSKGIGVNGSGYWDEAFSLSSNYDRAYGIAVDSSDNSIVAGYYTNATYSSDWSVIKIGPDGSTVWKKLMNWSSTEDEAYDVTIDRAGKIMVFGLFDVSGTYDWKFWKLDSDGNEVWNKTVSWSAGVEHAYDVATDSQNNIIAVGEYSPGMWDGMMMKLDSSGNQLWNKTFAWSADIDSANGVAVDSADNIYVVGNFINSSPSNHQDWIVVKLNSSGDELWSRNFSWTTNGQVAKAVAIDSEEDIIVIGTWDGGVGASTDWRVQKLDSSGNELWNKAISWSANFDYAEDVFIDSFDNIIVVGNSYNYTPSSRENWRILKLNSSGSELWNKSFSWNLYGSERAYGVGADSRDNVIAVGYWVNNLFPNWRVVKLGPASSYLAGLKMNSTTIRNSTIGVWLLNTTGGSIFNSTILGSGCGLSINNSDSYTITNTSFKYGSYGACIDASSSDNLFYYSNFTSNSVYQVSADASGNNFNTTGSGIAKGNFWDDALLLDIFDNNGDGFGDSGDQYPYSLANGGQVSSYVTDYGPIVTKRCVDNDGDGYGKIGTNLSNCTYNAYADCNDNNASIIPPRDDLNLTSNITLCNGTFYLNTSSSNGIVNFKTDNIILTCNSTIIIGNNTGSAFYSSGQSSVSVVGCNAYNYTYGAYLTSTTGSTLRNNTFLNNSYGTYLTSSSSNLIYYNVFMNSSLALAYSDTATNGFNTTVSGVAQGNNWAGVSSLKIYDTNNDDFGDGGIQYPYSNAKGGNVSANIADYGPLTTRTDYLIQPPVLFQPANDAIISDSRNPLYGWNDPEHTLSDSVTYRIQVDDDFAFGSPEVDVSNVAETAISTYYWSSSALSFTTDYYWRVRANDTYNLSAWTSYWHFNILATVSCAEPVDEIDFGNMCIFANQTKCDTYENPPGTPMPLGSHINDTLDNHPPPYTVENDGNLKSKGEIYSTSLWTSPTYRQMPSKYYQFMVGVDEPASYDWALDSAWVNMTNVSASAPESYYGWKWENVSDSFKMHIRLEVPTDEPAGVKFSTTYVTCEQNESIY